MGAGYVGILSVELHFPEAGSLKGKRKYVKSAKAQLQQRFGASVAEVDHHELWQRARLTVACVARPSPMSSLEKNRKHRPRPSAWSRGGSGQFLTRVEERMWRWLREESSDN